MSTQGLDIKGLVRTILQAYYKSHQIDGEPLDTEIESLVPIVADFIHRAEEADKADRRKSLVQHFCDVYGEEGFKAFMDRFI